MASELWGGAGGLWAMLVPGWVSSRCAEGVLAVWERELAARGWSTGGEAEEEVASGVVGVWEQVLGGLGLVGGGAVSSGVELVGSGRCWRLAGCLQGVPRGFWGGLGARIGCRWLVEWL
mgnify:CR=1 FL=1